MGFLFGGRAKGAGLALVGDIGGTNARFGLVDLSAARPEVTDATGYQCRDFPTASDAVRAYLREHGVKRVPAAAAIAVAGPVENGAIRFTNNDWSLSEAGLREMGFGAARLLNDYAALALAAPLLQGEDVRRIGAPDAEPGNRTIAVLGPGTGFGVSAVARDDRGEAILATEGGHVAFAPADEVEMEVLRRLSAKYGRVSVERILSGPGIVDLHHALLAMDGRESVLTDPAEITRRALSGDPECRRTIERFCAILGSVAGDFALAYGARGGVYVAGGIPPIVIDVLAQSDFRKRFEDKGRFAAYLAQIPTRVILRPHAALLGAAGAARSLVGAG
ncbi:glucokinase [Caulobacter sp. 17J80-11]|uniref:glucokinase n=1 Tax=Caulobacter sp. 17J80-11 TaxID=2763502 RepID=UPI001653524C|nr:glucokinase [Caulobacter sp. 17J80-11]MBC6983396.1 glucokinase [Caulobacter sp. 17J80-11]